MLGHFLVQNLGCSPYRPSRFPSIVYRLPHCPRFGSPQSTHVWGAVNLLLSRTKATGILGAMASDLKFMASFPIVGLFVLCGFCWYRSVCSVILKQTRTHTHTLQDMSTSNISWTELLWSQNNYCIYIYLDFYIVIQLYIVLVQIIWIVQSMFQYVHSTSRYVVPRAWYGRSTVCPQLVHIL